MAAADQTLPNRARRLLRFDRWRESLAPLLILLLLAGLISLKQPAFLSAANLHNVVHRNVPLALIALGQTMVIICGQIDLSVGSVMALASVSGALALRAGWSAAAAAAIALAVGALCGWLNGMVTTKARLPSFIVTLAMMGLARGVALLLSESRTVGGAAAFSSLVQTRWLGLSVPIWLLLLTAVALHLVMARTVFGRNAYATGANPTAAQLSGVRVDRNLVTVFTVCGLLVGLAGAIECGRNSGAQPTMGQLKELDAIAATVIGGASLNGGQGSAGGTLLGVAIMATLNNGANLLGIENEWQKVIIGPLIVLAVLYDRWIRRRR